MSRLDNAVVVLLKDLGLRSSKMEISTLNLVVGERGENESGREERGIRNTGSSMPVY